MDTALSLKMAFDKGEVSSFEEAESYLNQSALVAQLLQDFDWDVLSMLNRLTQLAEIPFVGHLEKVKNWLNQLVERSGFVNGFSFSGKPNDLLVCYHAMITSVLIRLNYHNTNEIEKGIQWILNFQPMERGCVNHWSGKRVLKYGGCLKLTPCYVGLVKCAIALSDYKHSVGYKFNNLVDQKLTQGLGYILSHQLYKKASNRALITNYITKLSFPFTYKTNVIELLRLLQVNGLYSDIRCQDAKDLLSRKQKKSGYWQVTSVVHPKHWVLFDKPKEEGVWLTYIITQLLKH